MNWDMSDVNESNVKGSKNLFYFGMCVPSVGDGMLWAHICIECAAVITQSIFSKLFIPTRHPIACLLGRGVGCLLWLQTLIHILPPSVQKGLQCYVILDRVKTVLVCTAYSFEFKNEGVIFGCKSSLMFTE